MYAFKTYQDFMDLNLSISDDHHLEVLGTVYDMGIEKNIIFEVNSDIVQEFQCKHKVLGDFSVNDIYNDEVFERVTVQLVDREFNNFLQEHQDEYYLDDDNWGNLIGERK